MIELWNESLALINLPFTILLVAVVIYWGMVVAGAVGMDVLDGDAEADMHIDVDGDAHVDLDADGHGDFSVGAGHGAGALDSMMGFVNVGKVPLTIIVSFFLLFLWVGAIAANYYLNPVKSILIAIGILVPNYLVAIFMTKMATAPMVPVYRRMKHEQSADMPENLLGMECRIVAGSDGRNIGQAEIKTERSTHRIYVQSKDGLRIARGKQALIVDYNDAQNIYLVKAI